MKSKKNICSVCLVLFFILVAGITLLPLILLAAASLSPGSELMSFYLCTRNREMMAG